MKLDEVFRIYRYLSTLQLFQCVRSIRSLLFLLLKKNFLRNSTPDIGGMGKKLHIIPFCTSHTLYHYAMYNYLSWCVTSQTHIVCKYAGTPIYWILDSACLSIQRECLMCQLVCLSGIYTLCQRDSSLETKEIIAASMGR